MKKRIISAIFTTMILSSFLAGCGSVDSGSSAEGNAVSTTAGEQNAETTSGNGEITKLVVWGVGNADTEDCNEVAEAISEITRKKIGVEIELVRGKDTEQINLALTTGEPIDLMNYNNISGQLTTAVRNNFAMPLDDLVNQYGKGALEIIDPIDLEACRYSGVLYALPDQKDTSHGAGFSMRKDIVDELGITVPEYGSFDDMHEILVKVHEAYPDMYPLVPTWAGGGMQEPLPIDGLGDNLGVIEDAFGDSTEVVNLYATDAYKNLCKTMYQWNQEGLVMPDATTTTENNLLSANGFAMYENWKPGKELENQKANGKEIVFMKLVKPYKMTTVSNGNSFMIPYSSKHPEKAMELWNLMYTDPEISNLFINGIEGKHWVYTDDTKTTITTPEGVDASASGYSSLDWAWPNQQITPVWEGADPDLWEKLKEFNKSGHPSPAFGFNWDSTNVLNQVTACNNVVSTYDMALRWGTMDPETTIAQFNKELEAAGINEIIAAKQKALDEYLASKSQ
ncbi:MAG: ABC transporter substrate-binding protein [Oribacterium sp.]|nr:ABC transporter substrate-binding protein [Oribacterium sp.]